MAVRWRRRSAVGHTRLEFAGFSDVIEIGAGSLSTVYQAREVDTGRRVALKLLSVRDTSPRAMESFQREATALGALGAHPHIVTLLRSTESPDGRPVLVLELCEGSVADQLGAGQLTVAQIVSIGIKLCGALETAHQAQILHRDVKPQNILITEFGEPALADFGVATLQSSSQTTSGLFDFTTLHIAPELLEGAETSAATDVYELASTLYQLIAGHSAFRAFEGESPASVILRILRDPVQPLGPSVPPRLSDLLVQAMAKDQAARPETAAQFGNALREIQVLQGWPSTPLTVREGFRSPALSHAAAGTSSPASPTPRRTGPSDAEQLAARPNDRRHRPGLRRCCINGHLVGGELTVCAICGSAELALRPAVSR